LDVRDGSAIKGFLAGFERLDVLINAAGVIRRDAEHDPEIFAETIAINLTGACAPARLQKPNWPWLRAAF
jgi:NAD(P)-dependent dehydrogenase (short-subunit alcohol dehydrogenase family)